MKQVMPSPVCRIMRVSKPHAVVRIIASSAVRTDPMRPLPLLCPLREADHVEDGIRLWGESILRVSFGYPEEENLLDIYGPNVGIRRSTMESNLSLSSRPFFLSCASSISDLEAHLFADAFLHSFPLFHSMAFPMPMSHCPSVPVGSRSQAT